MSLFNYQKAIYLKFNNVEDSTGHHGGEVNHGMRKRQHKDVLWHYCFKRLDAQSHRSFWEPYETCLSY